MTYFAHKRHPISIRYDITWFIAFCSLLVMCLAIGWWCMACAGYGFSVWYDVYGIADHIAHYAPQNDYISGLGQVTRHEHERLFSEIAAAVHNHGSGLSDIVFYLEGKPVRLLRQPEVIHLQDVANLIDVFNVVGYVSIVMSIGLIAWLLDKRIKPDWRQQLKVIISVVIIMVAGILVIGAKAVFYQLHVWVFPEEHQWFFYYQESLMTTLMKAPDLFAGISAAILLSGMLLFAGLIVFLNALLKKVSGTSVQ